MVKIFKSSSSATKTTAKTIEIAIDSLDHQSRGVGRVNGKVCFVAGALPGEKIKARISEDKKQYCQAELIKVLNHSAHRVRPKCGWYEKCGGCQLQHLSSEWQIHEKQARVAQFFAKVGISDLPWQHALQGDSWHYRTRTRLAAWYEGKQNKLRVGFRQYNSKKLVEVDECLVIAPEFSQILPDLVKVLNKLEHKKHISHLEFNSASQTKVLVLRILESLTPADINLLSEFSDKNNIRISLLTNDNLYQPVKGSDVELYYAIDDLSVEFGLSDFTQVNQEMNLAMINQALDWLSISKQDNVLDLFCGLGNFSLPLAKLAKQVLGVEGIQAMVEKATKNAKQNKLNNLSFIAQDLSKSDALSELNISQYNKIILDPSREGAANLVENSHKWSANLVLYIACEPSALVRDSQALIKNGYKISRIGLIDMFPQTSHVETMALFYKES